MTATVASGTASGTGMEVPWTMRASCLGMADELFCEAKDQREARKVCRHCPVRLDCLVEALDNRIEWGIWGGMTERERRSLLRSRTDVRSWRQVLTAGEA